MASTQTRPALAPANASGRRDQAWLLPSNRKLRNLVSISLRNLSLTSTSDSRARGKTIDDDALPQTLKSPAKLVALREQHQLEHSRSSSDLRRVAEDGEVDGSKEAPAPINGSPAKEKAISNRSPRTPPRPTLGRMRRRSTLEWSVATPQRRQEKLEKVTAERMADVFFSAHVEGVEEPVYISEIVERTMNPTFRHIDWSACGPGITRMDTLTLKFWTKSAKMRSWQALLEVSLCLRALQYIGKSLDQFHHGLPPNAVIFHLTDGVYTAFQSLSDYAPPVAPPSRTTTNRSLPTASFDALLRLSKLDESIQDALETRNNIAADLEALLESNKAALTDRDRVAEAEDRLKTIEYAKKTVEKQLEKARRQQQEKRDALTSRRELMKKDAQDRQAQHEAMLTSIPELPNLRTEHDIKTKAIRNQRRRICEDLQKVYPIHPISGKSLAFTIRDLYLPNSDDLDSEPPDKVAAALGHIAHLTLLLAFYLSQPLPYPLQPRSSTSTISDPISLLKTNRSLTTTYATDYALRTYPLFSRGMPRFRFEYGVFLLDKNLQILLESAFGVRVLDVRQTLPNLKYLLLLATAGEGELPGRKAGGVRGLLVRTPSRESVGSALSGVLWHGGVGGVGGDGEGKKGAVDSLRRNMGKKGG